ncbi:adenosylcobinamide-GDP ribazoletransferase [Antarctobacter sp.]|uniref:adenosylcobinamide-GDP ribazoletransferase n=1 Tax=Antarctobacter sp. TaxID=1872577 RepID=UPI002B267BB1|nr:adenosylcobinamide-GDP ribazoletransferase [Antarctobacter sp.]
MRSAVRLEAVLFWLAVRYLTRLPVPRGLPESDDLMVRAVKYHPGVGALVGALAALVLWAGAPVLPWPVAVLLSLAATLLVTGAFHEAGLAGAAEGLTAGRARGEIIAMMDRRQFGLYGALAVGLCLALKLALIASFPLAVAAAGLVAGHATGRMAAVHVTATTSHALSEGMQKFVPKVTADGYRVALTLTLVALALLTAVAGIGAVLCGFIGAVLLGQAFRAWSVSRIGGYTGECLGGAEQMAELGFYLGLALWL